MTKKPAGHFDDAWIQVDQTNDPGFFIGFLDASRTRALEFARKNPEIVFAHLSLKPGLNVLDCGCGTGDMLALIAKLTAPGQAVGVDLSQFMIQEARKRAETNSLGNLRFEIMDVQSLSFLDEAFDRVLTTQLLIHVPEPRIAMHELCRVTKKDGWIAIADTDWDTMLLGSSYKELNRRFTRLFSDGVRNNLVVREYAGWLRSEGFENIKIIPQQIFFDDWAFVKQWIIEPSLSSFLALGSMTGQEAQMFIDDLEDRNAKGYHFGAFTFYTVLGQRTQ
jgi:ubiquinone/menaquinone biosynthesis C-methylase UbiE